MTAVEKWQELEKLTGAKIINGSVSFTEGGFTKVYRTMLDLGLDVEEQVFTPKKALSVPTSFTLLKEDIPHELITVLKTDAE